MPATGLTSPPLRELAHRTSNGTDVTLFWNERTGALTVSSRGRTGQANGSVKLSVTR